MPNIQPSYRRDLNDEQLRVLAALYKFRFGTTDLLRTTQSKRISRQYMNTRLRILCEQEYIGRRYDSSYKLQAKFALYYLLPRGIEVLKQHPNPGRFRKEVLRNIRNDKTASNRFARHCISVFAAYCVLKETYGDRLKFSTRTRLSMPDLDYFPTPLPDAYAIVEKSGGGKLSHYILECFDDTMPHSVMKKKIKRLVKHADHDEWTPELEYPEIVLVCDTEALQRRTQKWATKAIEDGWTNDLVITTTTIGNLITVVH